MNMRYMCLALSLLAGCEQHYRYPCQNPANWQKPQCQKPLCDINQDCPEYVFAGTRVNTAPPEEAKHDCK